MLVVTLFSVACLFAALSVGAAVTFSVWLDRQSARLERLRVAGSPTTLATASHAMLVGFAPEAVVILCVRGHDPYLADTIRALARQDYSDYRLLVIVDHQLDPAWGVVATIRQELGLHDSQLELQELQDRHENCGLKCSALLQAIASLSTDTTVDRVIVTIDSDAVPDKSWLVNLLRPLADESIGATTSNQWFEPRTVALGSWVRAVWQAGAIVPTAILGNPWAGSFAVRHSDLLRSGLLDEWRTSIIDDGPVRESMVRIGKRIEFIPQNFVINREDCSLGFCFRYVARMLTWSRLFESTFWITAVHALLTTGIQAGVVAWVLHEVIAWVYDESRAPNLAWFAIGTLAVLLLSQVAGYLIIRRAILRTSLAAMNLHPARSGGARFMTRLVMVALAVPLATASYAYGCLRALRITQVQWRNIAYEVHGGRRIKLLDYSPYTVEKNTALENHSV
jgi:glycosyltransferase involved in cell wall biosynthesis